MTKNRIKEDYYLHLCVPIVQIFIIMYNNNLSNNETVNKTCKYLPDKYFSFTKLIDIIQFI